MSGGARLGVNFQVCQVRLSRYCIVMRVAGKCSDFSCLSCCKSMFDKLNRLSFWRENIKLGTPQDKLLSHEDDLRGKDELFQCVFCIG